MAKPICYMPHCEEPRKAHGFCQDHYNRYRNHGHPLAGGLSRSATLEQRFWVKVDKDGSTPEHRPDLGPCWLWTASAVPPGYGHMKANGRYVRAYRLAYQWAVGPIPDGLVLDHLCDNPPCVRPSHLEPKTIVANLLRSPKHNANKTHCKRGHEFTEANTRVTPRLNGRTFRQCRQCERDHDRARRRRKKGAA